VLAYERERGRNPHEMPPLHPGYDIESLSEDGEVQRYIEVKSLSGNWGPFNAAVTKTQFEKATELGDRFWLYVVERAEQNDFVIHPIPDPARRVNQFIYDDGWQDLAATEG
jgi:hypothetical protein